MAQGRKELAHQVRVCDLNENHQIPQNASECHRSQNAERQRRDIPCVRRCPWAGASTLSYFIFSITTSSTFSISSDIPPIPLPISLTVIPKIGTYL